MCVTVCERLWRTPSFTAVALLTLALGIGANAAIYQLLDAIRIRTLPVNDPEQLVVAGAGRHHALVGRRTSVYPGADESAVGAPSRPPDTSSRAARVVQRRPAARSQHRASHGTRTLRQRRFLQGARRGRARRADVHRRRRSSRLRRSRRGGQLRLLAAIPRRRSSRDRTDAVTQRATGRSDRRRAPGFSGWK